MSGVKASATSPTSSNSKPEKASAPKPVAADLGHGQKQHEALARARR